MKNDISVLRVCACLPPLTTFFFSFKLAYILQAHGSGLGTGLDQGLFQGTDTLSGDMIDAGFAWKLKEDVALDFLRAIQILAPGRILPAFQVGGIFFLTHYFAACIISAKFLC